MERTLLNPALAEAVELVDGQSEMAKRLRARGHVDVKQQSVWSWLFVTGRTPAEVVLDIEAEVDGKVSRHRLAPEVFGEAPANAADEGEEAAA